MFLDCFSTSQVAGTIIGSSLDFLGLGVNWMHIKY